MKLVEHFWIIIMLVSCANDNSIDSSSNKSRVSVSTNIEHSVIKDRSVGMSKIADTVLTYKIVVTKEDQCNNWMIPPKHNIIGLLKGVLTEMDGNEWVTCYGDWSCGAVGRLIFENTEYYYRLDAGGWIIITDGKNQRYFGCGDGNNCWKSFPSSYLCTDQ